MKQWRKEAAQRKAVQALINAELTQEGMTVEKAFDKLPSRLGKVTKRFIVQGQQYSKLPSRLILNLMKRI